mgnify:CR=1 FL=1
MLGLMIKRRTGFSGDIIRFGIAPLYNQSGDIDVAVSTLADILNSGVYREQKFSKRATVT